MALMTDTGSFRFSNTDSHAHRMAADLLTHGLDPQRIHAQVHAHASAARLRFFGEVLAALELLEDGRIVVLDASPEQFQKHGLVGADTEGLVDMPRNIAEVEAVVLFSEVEPGKVKVSMRSTGRIVVDRSGLEPGRRRAPARGRRGAARHARRGPRAHPARAAPAGRGAPARGGPRP